MNCICIYMFPTERRHAHEIVVGHAGSIILIMQQINFLIRIVVGISINVCIISIIIIIIIIIIIRIIIIIINITTQPHNHCAFALPISLPPPLPHLHSPILTLPNFLAPTPPLAAPAELAA